MKESKKVIVDGVDVSEYAPFFENEKPFDLNDFEAEEEKQELENKGELSCTTTTKNLPL